MTGPARGFVLVGQRASASPEFSLDDLAGSSGRLDVLLRALRAALLVSHGVRDDTRVYLVLLGGPRAPRTVRVDGRTVRFLRPEERHLATLMKKVLATEHPLPTFTEVRAGVALVDAGLDAVLADAAGATPYLVAEGSPDVRGVAIASPALFFVGDHLGFDDATRTAIEALRPTAIGLGPVSVHAEDAVAILANELDRRLFP